MDETFVKITSIVYSLLDFFPDADPLKIKAKDTVLSILEGVTIVSDADGWASIKKETASLKLLDDIAMLEAYLSLGKNQGWIDRVNFLIITNEYKKVKEKVRPLAITVRTHLQSLAIPEGKKPEPKKDRVAMQWQPETSSLAVDDGYNNRQKKILEVISQREKTQVADLIKEIPQVTKRTLRRDLDDLLRKGKITRAGEWNQVFYKI